MAFSIHFGGFGGSNLGNILGIKFMEQFSHSEVVSMYLLGIRSEDLTFYFKWSCWAHYQFDC